jgi:hypothetical protein
MQTGPAEMAYASVGAINATVAPGFVVPEDFEDDS